MADHAYIIMSNHRDRDNYGFQKPCPDEGVFMSRGGVVARVNELNQDKLNEANYASRIRWQKRLNLHLEDVRTGSLFPEPHPGEYVPEFAPGDKLPPQFQYLYDFEEIEVHP